MSEGKPQWITPLKTHFKLHSASCITNIQQPALPSRYFSAKHAIHFHLWWGEGEKKKECIFPAGKQPNHFNYIPNGCNLHIATSQCCVSETSTAGLTFSEQRKSPSSAERGRTKRGKEQWISKNTRLKEIPARFMMSMMRLQANKSWIQAGMRTKTQSEALKITDFNYIYIYIKIKIYVWTLSISVPGLDIYRKINLK